MRDGTLIVFIDSLPFSYVNRMSFLSRASTLTELTPGFGYSINLLPELFCGLRPDQLGIFGEWTYAPHRSQFAKLAWLLPWLDNLCLIPFTERIIRRLLHKSVGKTFNIPLPHLSQFARAKNSNVYFSDFPYPSIFSQTADLKLVLAYEGIRRQRDEKGYLAVREEIPKHNKIYLGLPDLDSYGHTYGVGAPEYDQKVQELDHWLEELHDMFLKHYPDGSMIVVSDHGMVDIKGGYELLIEEAVTPSTKETYTYFLDSTLLRVWIHDPNLRQPIHDYLDNLSVGVLLSPDERAQYGIKSQAFGDCIFVLNEGIVFEPSSFSNKVPNKAMHGYHPKLASQKAVFAAFGTLKGNPSPRTNVEVAEILMRVL